MLFCAVFRPGDCASPVVVDAFDDLGFFKVFYGAVGGLAGESAGGFADIRLAGVAVAGLEAEEHHSAEDGGVRGSEVLCIRIFSKYAQGFDVGVVASDADDALCSFPDVGGIAWPACLFEHVAEVFGGLEVSFDRGEVGFGGDVLGAVAWFPGQDAFGFAEGVVEVDFFDDWW